jgi:RHS repeat-associated protein
VTSTSAASFQKLTLSKSITTEGYIYIYVSNESTLNVNVFFDDMKITHTASSMLVQANDYYPFGLTFNSYQRENSLYNKYQFNGKEIQNELGLGWNDYGARFYDPQVPHFLTIDPRAEDYYDLSPYGYCAGNPIKHIDVNGEFIGTLIGTVVGAAAGAYDAYKNGGDVMAGASEGAVSGAIAGATVDLAVAATVATGGGALVVIGAGAAAGAIGGAAGAVAGDATGQVVTSVNKGSSLTNAVSNISTDKMTDKAKSGAITGAIGGAAGGAVGKGLQAATNSTKAVQGTMSKNITETAKTLTNMGADSKTVGNAVNKITTGMGQAGKNTVNTTNKVAAGTGMAAESSIQVGQRIKEEKKP